MQRLENKKAGKENRVVTVEKRGEEIRSTGRRRGIVGANGVNEVRFPHGVTLSVALFLRVNGDYHKAGLLRWTRITHKHAPTQAARVCT